MTSMSKMLFSFLVLPNCALSQKTAIEPKLTANYGSPVMNRLLGQIRSRRALQEAEAAEAAPVEVPIEDQYIHDILRQMNGKWYEDQNGFTQELIYEEYDPATFEDQRKLYDWIIEEEIRLDPTKHLQATQVKNGEDATGSQMIVTDDGGNEGMAQIGDNEGAMQTNEDGSVTIDWVREGTLGEDADTEPVMVSVKEVTYDVATMHIGLGVLLAGIILLVIYAGILLFFGRRSGIPAASGFSVLALLLWGGEDRYKQYNALKNAQLTTCEACTQHEAQRQQQVEADSRFAIAMNENPDETDGKLPVSGEQHAGADQEQDGSRAAAEDSAREQSASDIERQENADAYRCGEPTCPNFVPDCPEARSRIHNGIFSAAIVLTGIGAIVGGAFTNHYDSLSEESTNIGAYHPFIGLTLAILCLAFIILWVVNHTKGFGDKIYGGLVLGTTTCTIVGGTFMAHNANLGAYLNDVTEEAARDTPMSQVIAPIFICVAAFFVAAILFRYMMANVNAEHNPKWTTGLAVAATLCGGLGVSSFSMELAQRPDITVDFGGFAIGGFVFLGIALVVAFIALLKFKKCF